MCEREGLDDLGELIDAIKETEKQGPLIQPLPVGGAFNVCFDDGDDLDNAFEALGHYCDSWRAGFNAWVVSPAPVLIRVIGGILRDMPPMLPNDARLTSYYDIRHMVDHGEFTLMQKDAMRAMMTLFSLQNRRFLKGEFERTERRIRSVIASMLHDSAIWEKQIAEQKISFARLDFQKKAANASIKYSEEEKKVWLQLYRDKKLKNPRVTYNSAATSIAKERKLGDAAVESIRKHISREAKKLVSP